MIQRTEIFIVSLEFTSFAIIKYWTSKILWTAVMLWLKVKWQTLDTLNKKVYYEVKWIMNHYLPIKMKKCQIWVTFGGIHCMYLWYKNYMWWIPVQLQRTENICWIRSFMPWTTNKGNWIHWPHGIDLLGVNTASTCFLLFSLSGSYQL